MEYWSDEDLKPAENIITSNIIIMQPIKQQMLYNKKQHIAITKFIYTPNSRWAFDDYYFVVGSEPKQIL